MAYAELLTPHNYCHSFPPFFSLSSLSLLPSLGCPFQPSVSFCLLLVSKTSFFSSSCHSASHRHILPLFLSSFPLSRHLFFSVSLCLFLLSQSLCFYELRDSVLLISIFLWCRTELVTGVTASRFTAHTHTLRANKARINIMLSHRISSLLTSFTLCLRQRHIPALPVKDVSDRFEWLNIYVQLKLKLMLLAQM